MWGVWRLTGALVAALACSGPNPAYRVSLKDGSTGLDRGGELAAGDGVAMDSGALAADAGPAASDAGDPDREGDAPERDAPAPTDVAVEDAPTRDVVVAEAAPPDVAPPEGPRDTPVADLTPVDMTVPRGSGLRGDYFDGTQLEGGTPGTLDMTRLGEVINFDWPRNTSPDPRIDDDYFSVRWTGEVMPLFTGSYTFTAVTDDGVRLFVNNMMVLENWAITGPTTNSGSLPLVANTRYPIRMEYRETTQDAKAQLYWTPPGQPMQVVPRECLFPPPP
jgi:hypothetical protein